MFLFLRPTFVAALALFAATAFAQSSAPATPVITSYDATSATPSFHGTAQPGVTVRRDWSSSYRTTARADGTWDLAWSGNPLDAGSHTFFFDAVNSAGVSSTNSASVVVNVAVSGPPVMTTITDLETTWEYREKDYPISISVHATNLPSHYDVTGLPWGATFADTNPPLIMYTLGGITGGKFTVSVTATNSLGTSTPVSFTWTIHPGMTDFIHTDKAFYNAGDRITFKTHFSAPVVVTGTPYIPLWSGKKALYSGGSGTTNLTFTYQLAGDDPAASGLYFDTINAGDGTITTTDGVSASLKDSYWGLGSYPTFSVAAPGAPIAAEATVNGTVGVPIQPVQLQATNSPTSFSDGPWGSLSYYGLSISSSGLITGTPTRTAADSTTFTATNSTGPSAPGLIHVFIATADPAAPVITSYDSASSTPQFRGTTVPGTKVNVVSNGSYFVGVPATVAPDGSWTATWTAKPLLTDTYKFVAVATDAAGKQTESTPVLVNVPFGPPQIRDQYLREATYTWSRGDQTVYSNVEALNSPLHFSATGLPPGVSFGDFNPPYGDVVGLFSYRPADLTGGVYTASVTATNSAGTSAPVTIRWLVHPGMADFLAPNASQYQAGDVITLTAKFSAPVVVTGSPYVPLWDTKKATYTSGSGTSTLTFTYRVTSDDPVASGLYFGDVKIDDGTIATTDGVSASLHDTYYGTGVFPTFSIVAASSPPPGGTKTTPTITFASPTSAIFVGQPIDLGAISSAGLPITYSVVQGNATVAGSVLTPQSTATLVVRAATASTDVYNATSVDVNFGNPIPVGNSRLVNISSRLHVSADDAEGATIAGFVISGTEAKQILIRAVGPSLTQFDISNPASNPTLTLRNGETLVTTNSGWADNAQISAAGTAVGAFGLLPGSTDAAMLVTLSPGLYTAQVQSANSGTVLIEVYDVAATSATPTKQLINISSRGYVGTGQDVMIAGFVIGGDAPKKVLVRAIGPALSQFGVGGVLNDPVLVVYDGKQNVVARNDDWATPQAVSGAPAAATAGDISAAAVATGAFALPTGGKDAAVLLTLNPGNYSAVVSGTAGTTGSGLVEVYEVP